MKYNQLTLKANKKTNRVGRGIAAGQGKTAGRGTKGQNARAGGGVRLGFEGGQTPMHMRTPKLRGFKSFRAKTETVYTSQINSLPAGKVSNSALAEHGIIQHGHSKVKLVLNGDISKKFDISLQGASASAIKAVEKAGGKFTVLSQVKRIKKTQTPESK